MELFAFLPSFPSPALLPARAQDAGAQRAQPGRGGRGPQPFAHQGTSSRPRVSGGPNWSGAAGSPSWQGPAWQAGAGAQWALAFPCAGRRLAIEPLWWLWEAPVHRQRHHGGSAGWGGLGCPWAGLPAISLLRGLPWLAGGGLLPHRPALVPQVAGGAGLEVLEHSVTAHRPRCTAEVTERQPNFKGSQRRPRRRCGGRTPQPWRHGPTTLGRCTPRRRRASMNASGSACSSSGQRSRSPLTPAAALACVCLRSWAG